MSNQNENYRLELEQAIIELGGKLGQEFSDQIRPIILANLDTGRLGFFLEQNKGSTPADYVARVIEYYTRLHDYVHRLQHDPSADGWPPLFAHMQKLAYNILLKKQLIPGEGTHQLAVDSARDAAMGILRARFPYDADFGPWMYHFVNFACLKTISREANLAKQVIVSIEEIEPESHDRDSLSDNGHFEWSEHLDLAIAVSKLTPKRQYVLRLRYLEGLSSKETARIMGNSVSAVDKLHFDAIKQLRQLLSELK